METRFSRIIIGAVIICTFAVILIAFSVKSSAQEPASVYTEDIQLGGMQNE